MNANHFDFPQQLSTGHSICPNPRRSKLIKPSKLIGSIQAYANTRTHTQTYLYPITHTKQIILHTYLVFISTQGLHSQRADIGIDRSASTYVPDVGHIGQATVSSQPDEGASFANESTSFIASCCCVCGVQGILPSGNSRFPTCYFVIIAFN